jgi:hypothetical protein
MPFLSIQTPIFSALKSLSTDSTTLPQFPEVKVEPVDPAYEKSLSPLSLSPEDVSFLQSREALLQIAAIQYAQAVEMINSLFPIPQ